MIDVEVVRGGRVEVDLPSDAGFPVSLEIGGDVGFAWIEKELARGRRGTRVMGWRTCPDLPAGEHPLYVHDARGRRHVGTVTVTGG